MHTLKRVNLTLVNVCVKFHQFRNNLCMFDVTPNNFRHADHEYYYYLIVTFCAHSVSGKVIKRLRLSSTAHRNF